MPSGSPASIAHSIFRLHRRAGELLLLVLLWATLYGLALFRTPVLDDADATHAQAAQAMLRTRDLVTLHVNGIRYLEKPPLPYWITAASLRFFGQNSFAVHLPLALTVLALALLAWHWGHRAWSSDVSSLALLLPDRRLALPDNVGLYAGTFLLTANGTFLFTRVFIPDALLSLLLALALYAALRAFEPAANTLAWSALFWSALAAGVLTKGLIALLFPLAALGLYLALTREGRCWRRLNPLPGSILFLALASPWHILAGLRNRGGANGHGFFWFYFINEHVLRFLGRRSPPDYNKMPFALYWSLHLVWLFPWSFFAPLAVRSAWRRYRLQVSRTPLGSTPSSWVPSSFAGRSALLLALFSVLVLVFFSLSTNQEYYTFPVYLPLLLLLAAALRRAEADAWRQPRNNSAPDRLLLACQAALTTLCMLAALVLAAALWSSRHLPAAPDVGALLAHRGVGDYTLSLSRFFDLTTAAFSALRLPAALACAALALGSMAALALRARGRHGAATGGLVLMSAGVLVAAHLALIRFSPLLSSRQFALRIRQLQAAGALGRNTEVLLYGDQALGSSIPFYLDRTVDLVDGRSTSMLFGSTFADRPNLFLSSRQLSQAWGSGPRKLLFVPAEHRQDVEQLLPQPWFIVEQSAGKLLLTDRPLPPRSQPTAISGNRQPDRPRPAGHTMDSEGTTHDNGGSL